MGTGMSLPVPIPVPFPTTTVVKAYQATGATLLDASGNQVAVGGAVLREFPFGDWKIITILGRMEGQAMLW